MQNSSTLFYNFHDIVQVQVETDYRVAADFFAEEYSYHSCEKLGEGIPTVKLVYHNRNKGSNLEHDTYTKHRHKFLASWQYHIEFKPDLIHIEIIGNRFSIPLVHHMLLHPSLRYLCAKKEILILHAGAVAHGRDSFIITGEGGAGKTTTTACLLEDGGEEWRLHADDYVFLTPGGISLCYITRSHLYYGLTRWIPEISQRLTLSEKVRLGFFGQLRKFTRDGIKIPVRLPYTRLSPQKVIQPQAVVRAVIVLSKNDKIDRINIHPIQPNEFDQIHLLEMNFFEARHFLSLVKKSKSVPDFEVWIENWQKSEEMLLKEFLGCASFYRMEIPSKVTSYNEFRKQASHKIRALIPSSGQSDQEKTSP